MLSSVMSWLIASGRSLLSTFNDAGIVGQFIVIAVVIRLLYKVLRRVFL